MTVTREDLGYWRDPDDLLRALVDATPDLRDAVRPLVDHADSDIREEAIRKLYVSWDDRDTRDEVVRLFASDPVPEVRRTAAFGVAGTSTDRTRRDDTKVLLKTLHDPAEGLAVRGSAYEALLLMYHRAGFPPVKREIDLKDDVDWTWIRELERAVG